MAPLILSSAARGLLPLLLLFSLFLLLRGHNEPGGGFVGGLVAAAAYALYALAYGVKRGRQALRVPPLVLATCGLSAALGSGLFALAAGRPFLTSLWLDLELPVLGKLGTTLLFDTGVYLLVVGVVLTMLFSLMED